MEKGASVSFSILYRLTQHDRFYIQTSISFIFLEKEKIMLDIIFHSLYIQQV